MSNVLPLGNLPLLENIDLHGNPCTRENFYNVRLIAQFGDRYQEVSKMKFVTDYLVAGHDSVSFDSVYHSA